ncbi:TPA: DHH family phosphoesterase [Candidatus Woesearchaeota archaeon]|nr:DHH family phosphoesterase [Candidatus Woesearchaeota archaeon]HIH31726.1 DHH family phosphoesterase [Candidatus Woesearchaeota archaeon]HIH55030.1 DHH family phosphoesterase [Candidatus Woesearchaeota archaeon]HIJ01038.1 DHH family phosphoesterase [Candidatus Woesearchaeota archaeon]HIJ14754.1 DHH family phosphoesterase [Candidatus Woesearchaeota archaeon]
MQNYEKFKQHIKSSAESFNSIPKNESIKVIGHLDADGICSSAITVNGLIKMNRKYSLSILPTLTDESLKLLQDENEKYFVFVDLGSGSIDSIGKILDNKKIFILDHHHPQSDVIYENIVHVNPHLFDIDGSTEISGAGVAFLFTRELVDNTDMARIAIVGAIGDVQENNGFQLLNDEILKIAIENNLIEVKRGLKFFGVQTRPIHKLLQYSSDIVIPGITGSESGAINFLLSLGINPKLKNGFKKISDLTQDEQKKLIAGIIMKKDINSKEIFCNNYLLINEVDDSPFRDAKEFATLLNSCGRLGKASIGIGACLNDKKMKNLAVENLSSYRREIVNAINWYKDNPDKIIKKKNFIIINAEEEVMPTMIGTLGSILSKSPDIEKNMFILSLARNDDNTTKISLRITGNPENVNLKEIIQAIIEKINHGSSGGHVFASGAVIDTDYEEKFIGAASEVFEAIAMEERI